MSPSWLNLANRVAVVTGAGSGIGAAVARSLTLEQCRVVLVDRDEDKIRKVADVCSNLNNECRSPIVATCDVSDEHQVKHLFHSTVAAATSPSQPASILVNCAGITRDGWIGKMSVDDWQVVQDINLKGTFLCCREFLSQHQGQEEGLSSATITNNPTTKSIINVASVVATKGNLGQVNYAASKGGVLSFTKSLAKELAQRGVRVNCVVPGFIDTDMTRAVPDPVKERMVSRIPFGRFGHPNDVANLVLFLASCERSGYITGEAIECSGMISL